MYSFSNIDIVHSTPERITRLKNLKVNFVHDAFYIETDKEWVRQLFFKLAEKAVAFEAIRRAVYPPLKTLQLKGIEK